MRFIELVGQQDLAERLRKLVQNDRMPHALMLVGKSGYGTMPIARALAQYVNCENPTDSDSCGECAQCVKIQSLQHPDLLLSFPTISKKGPSTSAEFYPEFIELELEKPYANFDDWMLKLEALKKQANITALECRRIIDRLVLKPMEGQTKVMIMWLPEYLGKEGNILLKQIEEPSPNTLMIFVTESPEKVIGTIRSRVQSIKVPPIETAAIRNRLEGDDVPNPEGIAEKAEGDWRLAELSLDDGEGMEPELLRKLLNAVFSGNIDVQMDWVMDMESLSKNQVKIFMDYFSRVINLSVKIRYIDAKSDTEMYAISEKLLEMGMDLERLSSWARKVEDTRYAISRNGQLKLALHQLVIQLQYTAKGYEFS